MSATTWIIDPTHSEVNFKVKHLVISTVTGSFRDFEGSVESESDDFDGASVKFSAKTASVDTNQGDRDNHLRSADFFDSEKYPNMEFSGKVQKSGDDYKLVGNLTIKETAKEVVLGADFGGVVVDPYGNTKAGFELEGKINRKDFGLSWSAVTEAGNVVVSDQIRLLVNVEVTKQ